MADDGKGWRSRGSPLFVEDSYLGGVDVVDARQALHLPCTVTALTVQGNERTRRQLIEKEMKAALKAKTHAELAKELVNANARLYDLDIFRDATCFVDAGERDEDVTVRVVVEEKGTHTVSTGTFVQDGEGCLEVAWSIRNFAGDAQQVRGAVAGGFNQSSSVRLDFVRPYVLDVCSLHASLSQTSKHVPRPKSLREIQQAFAITVEQRDGPHAFTYELSSRRLDGVDAAEEGGGWKAADISSLKSAVRHSWVQDTRDMKHLPSAGHLIKSVTEFGGLLGRGANFARNETQGQWHAPVGGACTLSLAGSFGFLQALNGDVSRYSDRFFLGGPLSLRGFRSRGVGPRVGARDEVPLARGGEAMMLMAASLSRPLHLLPPNLTSLLDPRLQVFANIGNNVSAPNGKTVFSSVLPLISGMRAAVGVGIVFPTALGRLEMTLSKPLVYFKEDRTATWGIGLIPE